ncbi:MAG: DUF1295 domain-containing protein [Candidatus Thorarchaeota archaeon]
MDALIFAWAAIGPVVSLILSFPITIKYKDNSLVDLGWALGFVTLPWIGFIINSVKTNTWSIRQLLIGVIVTVWGIRLMTYIIVRKKIRKVEDKRFAGFRESWKKNFLLKSFLIIFIPQMFMVYLIGSSTIFLNSVIDSNPFDIAGIIMLAIGGFVWLQGFFFETVGDIQLLRFRKNPANKGKILNTGLWKYTRHPNYWGEATQWWGIFLIVIPLAFSDLTDTIQIIIGCLTILGPMLLTFNLLKLSGVNTLEKEGMLLEREGYKEYLEETSPFVPWFPKKKK